MITEVTHDQSFAYSLAWNYAQAGHQVKLIKHNFLYQVTFKAK